MVEAAVQQEVQLSIGRAGCNYDLTNDRIKEIDTNHYFKGKAVCYSLQRPIREMISNNATYYSGRKIISFNPDFNIQKQLSQTIETINNYLSSKYPGYVGRVDAVIPLRGKLDNAYVLYVSIHSSSRINPKYITDLETTILNEAVRSDKEPCKIFGSNFSIEHLVFNAENVIRNGLPSSVASLKDVTNLESLYNNPNTFSKYLVKLDNDTISGMIKNSNFFVVRELVTGKIVSALVAEVMYTTLKDGKRIGWSEFSEAATSPELEPLTRQSKYRGMGFQTALYKAATNFANEKFRREVVEHKIDAFTIYTEARSPWGPINKASINAGFVPAVFSDKRINVFGLLGNHCIIRGPQDKRLSDIYDINNFKEDLNVLYVPEDDWRMGCRNMWNNLLGA
ncbi:Uncharacterised protein [Candidatus Tiddalikarchaeum anstoanum]|nr:Uncharacterised protein [Candidatus Tiddalikarchaeum anstoanum]